MTGKGFLGKFLRGGLVNAFGQTGGLTGLGPKVSYDATKGFVGSNDLVGGYAGQLAGQAADKWRSGAQHFGQQGRSLGRLGPAIGSVVGGDIRRKPWNPEMFAETYSPSERGSAGEELLKGGLFGNFLK